jgi:hypothetical protein
MESTKANRYETKLRTFLTCYIALTSWRWRERQPRSTEKNSILLMATTRGQVLARLAQVLFLEIKVDKVTVRLKHTLRIKMRAKDPTQQQVHPTILQLLEALII